MTRVGSNADLETVRITMQSSADPRAARTRRAILDAVGQLTAHGVTTMSVSDVVREAGISRSSFYAHFSSLDEVAVGFLRQEFDAIVAAGTEPRTADGVGVVLDPADPVDAFESARAGYRRLVAHLIAHDSLYGSGLRLPLSRQAYDEAVTAYAEQMLRTMIGLSSVPAGVVPALAARYVAGGSLMIISSWIRGEIRMSDDELVEQLVALLPSWLDG